MNESPIESTSSREAWIQLLDRVARPVLTALAARRLRATMPIEAHEPDTRRPFAQLEVVGRLFAGIAPWLELRHELDGSAGLHREYLALLAPCFDSATAPDSPDRVNFTQAGQPLVDAAFLAQALLRSPARVWGSLDERVKTRVIEGFRATREIRPPYSNWLLFAAMIEAFLASIGERWDRMRVDYALRQMAAWYVGDGHYQDGPRFRADYYNGFVIHPMLLDVLGAVGGEYTEWDAMRTDARRRAQRYAEQQERLIAPDGSFPAVGRSIAYRCGAFQPLAQLALWRHLPESLAPGGVREALGAVARRTLLAPGTFDEHGWLRPGLCGHQPSLAEGYISTASLYLCSAVFLPLGLPAGDAFWTAPGTWTAQRVWSGEDVMRDHACD